MDSNNELCYQSNRKGKGGVMGNTYEVYRFDGDKYILEYAGESYLKAIQTMQKLKDDGEKCVKLEWR